MLPAPGKPCQPPRAFCPATEADIPHKSLICRDIAFCACVMTRKERKRRANSARRLAPGKKRPRTARFDRIEARHGPRRPKKTGEQSIT